MSQSELIKKQYRDSTNLRARGDLHQQFGTNKHGWFDWVFDRIVVPNNGRILEVGCGHGLLWQKCIARVDPAWTIVLSDLSAGMLDEACHALDKLNATGFKFEIIDAQNIPLEDNTYDTVIANHCLYHVPDRPRAISELQRVLKPGGRLLATTVGEGHMAEIRDLIYQFDPRLLEQDKNVQTGFTLQTGKSELDALFDTVHLEQYNNSLVITEINPLIEYVCSYVNMDIMSPQLDRLHSFLSNEFQQMNGEFPITTQSGMFVATKAKS